jgi:predicted permease
MRRSIRKAWRCLLFLVHRDQVQADLDEEMQFHLECRAKEEREAGAAPDQARRDARRAFGSTLRLRESGAEMWGWGWLDRLTQDVRWTFRTLRRTPTFAIAAVLTLALGLGVNTAIFTVVRAHLLRPLPYPHADRLVWVFQTSRSFMAGEPNDATEAVVDAWREHSRLLDRVATFVVSRRILTGMGEAEEVATGAVSPDLFTLLGVQAWRGRLFMAAENRRGADNVVVLSYAFWQRRFGADLHAIGRQLTLGARSFTIIGILPQGFGFAPLDRPQYAWLTPRDTDVWKPVSTESTLNQATDRYYLNVLGRLRPGATPAQAQDELIRIASETSGGDAGAVVLGLQQELMKKVRLPLLLLAGAAGFVLLIVCANVAQLQLARGMARGREMAIRTAVGAGRARIVRQLLVESGILAVAGGLLGLLVVRGSLALLLWLAGDELPAGSSVTVDGWVLGFALAASLGAAVLFGLFPAWQAARVDPQAALKEGGRGPGGHTRKITGALVVTEVAIALVLVACAALMLNTVWRLQNVELGFNPDHIVAMTLKLPGPYDEDGKSGRFIDEFLARIRTLPGVVAAEAVNSVPMGGAPTFGGFTVPGDPERASRHTPAQFRVITPGYFAAMGIPLRRGRWFTDDDRNGGPAVVIVNETMEREHLGGQAIGKRLTQNTDELAEVVGVVGDIRHVSQRSEPLPEIYHPFAQQGSNQTGLVLRLATDLASTAVAVRKTLLVMEPRGVITRVSTMEERRASALGPSRILVYLLSIFAGLALLLALIGGYGVVSYWVSQRRQEFGVRLALGASAGRVTRLVVRETLALITAAVVLGVAGAAACTRLLSSYLFGVEPTDPVTMAAAVGLVIMTMTLAAYLPARRAATTDPVVVLRQD